MSNARNVRLRELLHSGKILVAPCCHDALSASLIEQSGFEATFVSGAAATNTSIGISDVGLLSYGEYRGIFQNILNATSIPVLVDVDTGYGGLLPIMRMVEEYEAMGISGIQMEDQVFPKRCVFWRQRRHRRRDVPADSSGVPRPPGPQLPDYRKNGLCQKPWL